MEPPPDSAFPKSEPPSGALASDDFLYHLYRGSEFLQDNRVEEAKEELERALKLQPRDVEGHGLLGIVYFRLGLYPRAIDIYERITQVAPLEIAPKVNLALCYLKTGQLAQSRQALEDVIAREPKHRRAWAYLGLIFQRNGEFSKAKVAFQNAGQIGMADRMQKLEEQEQQGAAVLIENHPLELRDAADGAFQELEHGKSPFAFAESTETRAATAGSSRWEAIELGEAILPQPSRLPKAGVPQLPETEFSAEFTDSRDERSSALAVPLGNFVQSRRLLQPVTRQATLIDECTVHLSLVRPFAVRASSVRAVHVAQDAWSESRLLRRTRAREFDEPLGGAKDPIVRVVGDGELIARAQNQKLTLVELNDECLTLREGCVLGFDGQLHYEWTRLALFGTEALPMLELSGKGLIILRWTTFPRTLNVGERCTLVHGDVLAGWTGRLVPKSIDAAESPGKLRGFVGFTGEGQILVF
jgi:Flp pilus assembly protein TadD